MIRPIRLLISGPLAAPMGARCFHTTAVARQLGRGTFFAYLGLPVSPELDVAAVQRAYHNLQRRVHPDQANVQARAAVQEEEEEAAKVTSAASSPPLASVAVAVESGIRQADTDDSTYANASYETLRDPFLRCRYLLQLCRAETVKGSPLTPEEEEALMHEDDSRTLKENQKLAGADAGGTDSAAGDNDISLPIEFLAEMMAANESIFSADSTAADGRATLQLLIAHMEERYEECYSNAKACWKNGELCKFRRCILEWTYIRNALIHARNRLD
ncbi:putative heat shock protein [Trypanosoma grayi]|uniref:putative heat shock protein n=1 Tax=Trypanosoma grayi TaxID=71804 RepID=UPI0004F45897|nr:putative heat shock protein [Trypanosoma grayi]KEG13269.1 putative heat shock protein [Trypanosoma grayi]